MKKGTQVILLVQYMFRKLWGPLKISGSSSPHKYWKYAHGNTVCVTFSLKRAKKYSGIL